MTDRVSLAMRRVRWKAVDGFALGPGVAMKYVCSVFGMWVRVNESMLSKDGGW